MGHAATEKSPVYGIIAEFSDADAILHAAERAYSEGYRKMEAYSPFPVHGLAEALGPEDHRVKWLIFFGGIAGVSAGIWLQYMASVVWYPHNVGGKEHWSWPLFVPVAYESMILVAALSAVFGMLALNGLPRPHHPIFNAKRFELASQDRFFLCIEAEDPKFDLKETMEFMKTLEADDVSEVLNDDED